MRNSKAAQSQQQPSQLESNIGSIGRHVEAAKGPAVWNNVLDHMGSRTGVQELVYTP